VSHGCFTGFKQEKEVIPLIIIIVIIIIIIKPFFSIHRILITEEWSSKEPCTFFYKKSKT